MFSGGENKELRKGEAKKAALMKQTRENHK